MKLILNDKEINCIFKATKELLKRYNSGLNLTLTQLQTLYELQNQIKYYKKHGCKDPKWLVIHSNKEIMMKDKARYSDYECPYAHLEKECGHELKGPEGYENTYGVWCDCGFRGPVFYLEPDELKLKKIPKTKTNWLLQ